MADWILTRDSGVVFEIVLNRPKKRNALNWQMMKQLETAIGHAEQSASARLAVVRGEGGVFSAGIDVESFSTLEDDFGPFWKSRMAFVTSRYQQIVHRIESSRLPYVALLEGFVLGLGLEVALACDFRFAARDAKLGLPEVRIGLIPDVGGTTRLAKLIGFSRAKELIMTGRIIGTQDAHHMGLIDRVAEPEELYPQAVGLAEELCGAAPLAVGYAKRIVNTVADIDTGLQLEATAQSHLINSRDFEVGLRAGLEKKKPEWTNQ